MLGVMGLRGRVMDDVRELDNFAGQIIKKVDGIEKESEFVTIEMESGDRFQFSHDQDCCEHVRLDDFEVDLDSIVGSMVISAEEVINRPDEIESVTWTFYKIETNKGGIWLRWCGESNGYYSESVDIIYLKGSKGEGE